MSGKIDVGHDGYGRINARAFRAGGLRGLPARQRVGDRAELARQHTRTRRPCASVPTTTPGPPRPTVGTVLETPREDRSVIGTKTVSTSICVATIYFSYNQFLVFDRAVKLPGCDWTEAHVQQGFARRAQTVGFRTMLEFGHGDVCVYLAPYEQLTEHQRVIEIPLEISSGEAVICGPEEPDEQVVKMQKGHYRLVAAQRITGEAREAIDLYFEVLTVPLEESRVLIAGSELAPPAQLVESAEVAGEYADADRSRGCG